MIYLLLGGVCTYLGIVAGLGGSTLLRPLLDAVSPLPPSSVAALSAIATLGAALVCAFFMLSKPLPLHQDELILLAVGGVLGGVVGELISARFMAMIGAPGAKLLQNALLFPLLALPAVYFGPLSRSIRPLALTRMASLPSAFLIGLLASFLAFGAQPLTLALYYVLFDAEDDEAAGAALTVALTAMAGKLLTLLIRERFTLPEAGTMLFLLPGALVGALLAMIPALRPNHSRLGDALLRFALFAAAINMAAALAH